MTYPLSKQCNGVREVLEGEVEKDTPALILLEGNFTYSEPKLKYSFCNTAGFYFSKAFSLKYIFSQQEIAFSFCYLIPSDELQT